MGYGPADGCRRQPRLRRCGSGGWKHRHGGAAPTGLLSGSAPAAGAEVEIALGWGRTLFVHCPGTVGGKHRQVAKLGHHLLAWGSCAPDARAFASSLPASWLRSTSLAGGCGGLLPLAARNVAWEMRQRAIGPGGQALRAGRLSPTPPWAVQAYGPPLGPRWPHLAVPWCRQPCPWPNRLSRLLS